VISVIIHGCNGKMGKVLQQIIASDPDLEIVAGIDKHIDGPNPFKFYRSPAECEHKADILIDFSHYTATAELLDYCIESQTPVIIATTGLGDDERKAIRTASDKIPVFHSANMSLGINVIAKALGMLVPTLEKDFNIEIIEKHHNKKADSPSGTALLLAETINEACQIKKDFIYGRHGKSDSCKISDLGIHAVRGGSIPGEHTLLFAGPDEVIEITHTAYSKEIFAMGAIKAAKFLVAKEKGLYSMKDLV
jgi:4-hydroxy-tetrahydrodipicolinate reductase